MPDKGLQTESFQEFKNSFAYGTRSDLNFKFLKGLSDEDAAQFFQDLLWKLGASLDDGDSERLLDHVREWQIRNYSTPGTWKYDDGPFTPLRKPVSQSRLVLLSSSGHFVAGHDPGPFGVKNMTQDEAMRRIDDFLKEAPTLSEIPFNTPREKLCVRHGGYDIRGAQADPNVVLPLERLLELQREGLIGELVPQAYSFMGASAQMRLLKEAGPQWASLLKQQKVDLALLVPA
jgi:glycine/sarcosine/betaine reductase selenoprotein B